MANFTITISNTLDIFGESPSSMWGAMTWGVDKWGDSSKNLVRSIEKLVTNSFSTDSALTEKNPVKLISNSLSPTSETTSEGLTIGNYSYVFIKPTTQAEDRQSTTWTGTSTTTSWTSGTNASTTWS